MSLCVQDLGQEPAAELEAVAALGKTSEITLEKLGKGQAVKGQDTIELNSEDEGKGLGH